MFHTHYTYQEANKNGTYSDHLGTDNQEESLTQQSDLEDSDINVIMEKYGVSGQVPGVLQQGIYGDFTNIGTYRDAVERIKAANDAFAEVPAKLRKRFDNDPQQFIDWATNPENLDELRKLGLAQPVEIKDTPPPAPTPEPKKEEPK